MLIYSHRMLPLAGPTLQNVAPTQLIFYRVNVAPTIQFSIESNQQHNGHREEGIHPPNYINLRS
jgi:hypothetical protein